MQEIKTGMETKGAKKLEKKWQQRKKC
jgi:hypothetical protein